MDLPSSNIMPVMLDKEISSSGRMIWTKSTKMGLNILSKVGNYYLEEIPDFLIQKIKNSDLSFIENLIDVPLSNVFSE